MSLTKEIQNSICKAEIQKGNLVAENFNYFFTGELDVISVNRSGYVNEFEVKVSRPDFKADAKKSKWYYFDTVITPKYIPNYFTYVCPEGIIKEVDIKPYQGLIYYKEGSLEIIKRPILIHKHKHDLVKLVSKMLRITNWKQFFGACQLTIQNREIKARNDKHANSEWRQRMAEVNKLRNPQTLR